MTLPQMCYIIASHPAAVSRYLNKCVQKIPKYVLYSQHAPLGTVKDFFLSCSILAMW